MRNQEKFAPVIFNDSAQKAAITCLKRWIDRIWRKESERPICRGISKLIELDLLRYGRWAASFGPKTALAITRRSTEAGRFIDEQVYPLKLTAGLMLHLFVEGRALMEPGYRDGNPEFIFYAAAEAPELVQ